MATTTAAQLILRKTGFEGRGLSEECWDLIHRYRGELLNQACSIVGDAAEAEDVVQETFCDAFREQQRLAEVESIGAWLRAVNRANALERLKQLRRGSAKLERKQREMPGRFETTGGFTRIELREQTAKAMESLPEQHRAVVAMRYWQGLAHDEIAGRLRLPIGTVRRLFYEANVKLYDKLQPHLEPARGSTKEERS